MVNPEGGGIPPEMRGELTPKEESKAERICRETAGVLGIKEQTLMGLFGLKEEDMQKAEGVPPGLAVISEFGVIPFIDRHRHMEPVKKLLGAFRDFELFSEPLAAKDVGTLRERNQEASRGLAKQRVKESLKEIMDSSKYKEFDKQRREAELELRAKRQVDEERTEADNKLAEARRALKKFAEQRRETEAGEAKGSAEAERRKTGFFGKLFGKR